MLGKWWWTARLQSAFEVFDTSLSVSQEVELVNVLDDVSLHLEILGVSLGGLQGAFRRFSRDV